MDKVQTAILKTMGVKKGVPDLCLPVPRGTCHGLYIEMKALDGKPEADQLWWEEQLKHNGYFTCFADDTGIRDFKTGNDPQQSRFAAA